MVIVYLLRMELEREGLPLWNQLTFSTFSCASGHVFWQIGGAITDLSQEGQKWSPGRSYLDMVMIEEHFHLFKHPSRLRYEI
jgi:hypothetical protein